MANAAQNRAMRNYRARLISRGFSRFEIMALDRDRDLIRALARRLAEGGSAAEEVRAAVKTLVASEPAQPGGILAALRRSPLVGADLDLARPQVTRDIQALGAYHPGVGR
ncbi:hypothetical protein CKO38_13020 [Rhodospirillum rubrum]|nr:hypothetical protein [Rhodospirillum rubrum]MBK1677572.1 hypothetical protein [Rhodospirillum rubrum]